MPTSTPDPEECPDCQRTVTYQIRGHYACECGARFASDGDGGVFVVTHGPDFKPASDKD